MEAFVFIASNSIARLGLWSGSKIKLSLGFDMWVATPTSWNLLKRFDTL